MRGKDGAPVFPVVGIDRFRMATDGEGVTTLVCAWGCPLRCAYCINQFTWEEKTAVSRLSPAELYERVKLDSLYFEATGGGITFGGGEPLLYAEFFPAFREQCGSKWRLYAETSLCAPEEHLSTAARALDGFIVDIKDTDPAIYRAYTGQDNALVLRNLRRLTGLVDPADIRVRLPLIPGYNNEENRRKSEEILRKMGIVRIEKFDYVVRNKGC